MRERGVLIAKGRLESKEVVGRQILLIVDGCCELEGSGWRKKVLWVAKSGCEFEVSRWR